VSGTQLKTAQFNTANFKGSYLVWVVIKYLSVLMSQTYF